MTIEEAKELLPIIQAFADGKAIQYRKGYEWIDIKTGEDLSFLRPPSDYRIKPEPRYRPFKTQEECWKEMLKHQPIGYIKSKKFRDNVLITKIATNYLNNELYFIIGNASGELYYPKYLFNAYTFADGTPFGIKEE